MSRAIVIPIAAGAMLLACKHSEKLEILASGHTEAVRLETSQSDTVTTRSEGPEREIRLEFAPPDPPSGTAAKEGASMQRSGGLATTTSGVTTQGGVALPVQPPDGLPPHGALLKATIIERGPVLQETHLREASLAESAAKSESVSKAVHEEKSAPATGCMLGLGFWLSLALCGGLALLLKLRPWQ